MGNVLEIAEGKKHSLTQDDNQNPFAPFFNPNPIPSNILLEFVDGFASTETASSTTNSPSSILNVSVSVSDDPGIKKIEN